MSFVSREMELTLLDDNISPVEKDRMRALAAAEAT